MTSARTADRFAAAGREADPTAFRDGALVHIGKHDRGPLTHEQLGHRQTQPPCRLR